MKRAILCGALAVAAGGCATFEKQKGHDQVAALVRERSGATTGWGEGSPGAEQIAARVDALLGGGLTLDGAVEIALLNSPALQATYEELGVSQAEMIQAGLLSNPTLDIKLGFPLTPSTVNELEIGLVQELVELLMLPLRTKVAAEQFQADILRVSHEALQAAAEAKKQLAAVQAEEQLLEARRKALQAAEAAADLAHRQHRAGGITDLELAERTVAHEQARVEVAQVELSLAASRERLNRLLGLWGPRTEWKVRDALPGLPVEEVPLDRLESMAIRRRLDLAVARHEVAMLARAADLARTWRYFGRVEVGVDTHQDADGPRLLGPSLVLELPVFDQRQAAIARLEAQQHRAERRLAALSVDARSEVREARARLLAARQLVLHLDANVLPLRRRVVEHSLRQYNGMQLGLYQLLEAKRAELDSERDRLEALREYWSWRFELEKLVGGRIAPLAQEARR